MTHGDREGKIFLSDPHTNNRFFFLHNIKYDIFTIKKAPKEVPKYAGMHYINM